MLCGKDHRSVCSIPCLWQSIKLSWKLVILEIFYEKDILPFFLQYRKTIPSPAQKR